MQATEGNDAVRYAEEEESGKQYQSLLNPKGCIGSCKGMVILTMKNPRETSVFHGF